MSNPLWGKSAERTNE